MLPLCYSFRIAFFTSENPNIQLMAMSVFILAIIGGINMVFSFIFLDREKNQSSTIEDFRGKDMFKIKTILWDLKKTHKENSTEEYGNLLKIKSKDIYASNENLTKREYYAMRVDEARRDYAYFFLNLYDKRREVGKRFLKKKFKPDDIKLLLEIVEPMEKIKVEYDKANFDKKEAFDYFRELFKKVKK